MKPGEFKLDGKLSSEYGTMIQSRPLMESPQRRTQFKTAFGLSGEQPFDEDAYDNTDLDLSLIVKGTTTRSASYNREFVQHWFDSPVYLDFIPYFDESKIYKVMLREGMQFQSKYFLEEHLVVSAPLTVLPYKMHVVSPKTVLTTSGSITNPSFKHSLPLIKINGTGNITLTVNGKAFILQSVAGHIWLDCEFKIGYTETNGVKQNQNMKVKTMDYPFLKSGNNTISWTGTVTSVEIYPNWRSLV